MAIADITERWHRPGTLRDNDWTAGMEMTSRRWVERTRHIPPQNDPFPLFFEMRIGDRDR